MSDSKCVIRIQGWERTMSNSEENVEEIINNLREIVYNHKNEHVRASALYGMLFVSRVEEDQDLYKIIPYLVDVIKNHKSNNTRIAAMRTLENYEGDFLFPSELESLVIKELTNIIKNDENEKVRKEAIDLIMWLGDTHEIIKLLISVIKTDLSDEVKIKALYALGWIGSRDKKHVINFLKKGLEEEKNKRMKFWFAYTLARIQDGTGKGLEVLKKMEKEGELNEKQMSKLKWFYNDLKRKEKRKEIIGHVSRLSFVSNSLGELEKVTLDEENKEQLATIRSDLDQRIEIIETDLNEMEELIQKTKKEGERTTRTVKSFERSLMDYDHLEAYQKERLLQTQIDSLEKRTLEIKNDLKGDLKKLENRVDKKITLKDEFAGFWKAIVVIGFIISIVLTILKIIEAVRK